MLEVFHLNENCEIKNKILRVFLDTVFEASSVHGSKKYLLLFFL
jgi:hypothetical protein